MYLLEDALGNNSAYVRAQAVLRAMSVAHILFASVLTNKLTKHLFVRLQSPIDPHTLAKWTLMPLPTTLNPLTATYKKIHRQNWLCKNS